MEGRDEAKEATQGCAWFPRKESMAPDAHPLPSLGGMHQNDCPTDSVRPVSPLPTFSDQNLAPTWQLTPLLGEPQWKVSRRGGRGEQRKRKRKKKWRSWRRPGWRWEGVFWKRRNRRPTSLRW